jgi:hypothetical protein
VVVDSLGGGAPEPRTVDLTSADLQPLDGTLPLVNLNVPDHGVEDMCALSYLHVSAGVMGGRGRGGG